MMLVQKPPTFSLSQSMSLTHRRHPSAPPAVVVQPTRTPGLLSLSKPPRTLPQRQPQQRINKPSPRKISQVVRAPLLNSSDIQADLPSQTRGRQYAKEKSTGAGNRSASRGKQPRQPSPPQQQLSSQAEVPTISSLPFDPFLDHSSTQQTPSTTVLSSLPSGKLARRRQINPPATPTPVPALPFKATLPPKPSPALSKAIPVPHARSHKATLSRSEPVPSHMRPVHRRSSTVKVRDFPICDDMTDAGDASDNELPTTPTRKRPQLPFGMSTQFAMDNGPATAPLSARNPGSFPFHASPSPQPPKRNGGGRKHNRTPSEGIFHMSSDEDIPPSPGAQGSMNSNVQALFGLNRSPFPMPYAVVSTPPRSSAFNTSTFESREKQLEQEAADRAAGYFASSVFQNSPSPEDLPDPMFI